MTNPQTTLDRDFYRSACDRHFLPSVINDWEDDEALIAVCKRVMDANKIPHEADDAQHPNHAGWTGDSNEGNWLEFVYRAQELCEMADKGHCYRWQNGKLELTGERHV